MEALLQERESRRQVQARQKQEAEKVEAVEAAYDEGEQEVNGLRGQLKAAAEQAPTPQSVPL